MLGLGIETSCDETSIAIVEDGRIIRSCAIYSQIDEHALYGGVVPEIASRSHLEKINGVYAQALAEAGVTVSDLGYVAVTNRPGLVGSLMIGGMFAKCLNLVTGIPVVPVDHLEGHFYAVLMQDRFSFAPDSGFSYPFLGLLLSGGNSALFKITKPGDMQIIGDTSDDACGEAFDKTAAMLGLSYPGGPSVERAALSIPKRGEKEPSLFTPLLRDETDISFSFSGIKTAVSRAHAHGKPVATICRDFQETAFELVKRMTLRASERTGIKQIVASGGVLANSTLRSMLKDLSKSHGLDIVFPESKALCTDNAAMVASLGYFLLKEAGTMAANSNKKGVVEFSVSDRR